MNIIPYFTLGFPDDGTLQAAVRSAAENGIRMIELGFPSQDPKYDGPGIRKTHAGNRASMDAFDPSILSILREHGISYYALLYYSDIHDSLDRKLSRLKELGFSGIILPDLLIDFFGESREVILHIQAQSLELIPFFTQATPDAVISDVSQMTSSWIYYGLQPSTGIIVPLDLASVTQRVKALLPGRDVVYGFGIRGTEDIKLLRSMGAYGAAVGSLFVKYLGSGDVESISRILSEMEVAASA